MTRRRFAALAVLALLSGCAHVGRDYGGPDTALSRAPAVSAPFASTGKGPFLAEPVPDHWWRLYDDPQLDALISEALVANSDLRVALANISRAQALVREAAAQAGVQTGVNGSGAFAKPAGADGAGQVTYNAGFSVAYEVDLVGRLQHLIDAAQADAEAAQAAYDLARINVAAGVVSAYADACSAAYQRTIVQHSLDLQVQSLAMTERLINGGRATALDRTRARVLVEQLNAQLPAYDIAHENALFRLAVLLGRPPADFPAGVATCAVPPSVRTALPVGDGAALIRRRPDIRAAERSLAAATARTGLAAAELYPTIRLGGGLSSAGPLSGLGSSAGFGFSLGSLISWTFPNRTIAHAHIDQAEASRQAALARFDGTLLNALRETESALTAYAHELERNMALRAAYDAAQKAVAQTQRLYRAGRESSLAVLDAQRTLAVTQSALAVSDVALASDQVTVFLALGGGWQN